jgi:hypothetical protein
MIDVRPPLITRLPARRTAPQWSHFAAPASLSVPHEGHEAGAFAAGAGRRFGTWTIFWHPGHRARAPARSSGAVSDLPQEHWKRMGMGPSRPEAYHNFITETTDHRKAADVLVSWTKTYLCISRISVSPVFFLFL